MSVHELQQFMKRCRVSRHQLISTLEDVEDLKGKIAVEKEKLKKIEKESNKMVKEEVQMSREMNQMEKSHKHATARKVLLTDEASKIRSVIVKRKAEVKAAGQEYRMLVGHFHKWNDAHAVAEKEAQTLFKELVAIKKDRDQLLKQYEINTKLVVDRQMEIQEKKLVIKKMKDVLASGMKIALKKNNQQPVELLTDKDLTEVVRSSEKLAIGPRYP
eukprot:jgi/Bigna1/85952/estExt_fgenesh1_pg.C_70092